MSLSKMSLLNKLETLEPVWLMVAEMINYKDLLNIEKSGTLEVDDDGHAHLIDMAFKMMDTLIVSYGPSLVEKMARNHGNSRGLSWPGTYNEWNEECLSVIESAIYRCRNLKRFEFWDEDNKVSEYEFRQVGQLLAKHCPMLKQIQCDQQVLMTSYLKNLETKSTNLRKLSVDQSDNSKILIRLLKMSPLLEELSLKYVGDNGNSDVTKLVNVLSAVAVDGKCFPNLQKLTIDLNSSDRVNINIRPIFNFLNEVDTLTINNFRASEENIKTIRAINTRKQFKHIELNRPEKNLIPLFDPSTLTCLTTNIDKISMALIMRMVNLEQLMSTTSCISPEILRTIGHLPNLKRLRISRPQYAREWWTALDELVQARPSLVVTLGWITVTAENSKHIYETIERNPKNLFAIGATRVTVKKEEDLIIVKEWFLLVNVQQGVIADMTKTRAAERQSLIKYYDNLRIEKEVLDLERISNKVLMIQSF